MPLASEYIEGQTLAPTGWSSGEWALVNAQIRERSFFMAGVNQAHILQRFRAVAAAVAGGTMGADEARIVLREFLAESGYRPEEGKEGTLQDLSSSARLNLVIDTNVRQARGWAQHVQYQRDPNVGGQELFRRFARAVPRNWMERWAEAAEAVGWEGVARSVPFVALLDSPVWRALSRFDLPYPPFDFNSGMATRPVSVERCRELGLTPQVDTPPPSLNEETSASTAGLDTDLVRGLEEVMGGLVRREGNRLQMADVNGTRPYTAPQLAAVLAAPLPKGVPRLQLEALTAWRKNPQALLPGGEKHHLLPALRMLAGRLRPEAPKELQDFLRRVGEGAAGVVTNSRGDCRAEDPAHCRYHHPKGTNEKPIGVEFIESEGGKKLHEWFTEARNHGAAPMATPEKKDIHLIKGNQKTIDRLKQLVPDEDIGGLILTAQQNAARHMAQHDLDEKRLGYMQATFRNWDTLDRAANGQLVFTKDIDGEKCCLTATLGGKKWLVDGARKLRLVTFYTSRVAKTNFKKTRRKTAGRPDSHRAY